MLLALTQLYNSKIFAISSLQTETYKQLLVRLIFTKLQPQTYDLICTHKYFQILGEAETRVIVKRF